MRSEAERLFAEAELTAERTAAVLRLAVVLALGGTFVVAVGGHDAAGRVPVEQLRITITVLAGYLALGVLAFAVARPRLYRPWVPWVFATLDVGFIALSVALNLAVTTLASNHTAGLPVVWLIPLILAFGAMRYNPYLQGYVALLLVGGLAAAAGLGGAWPRMTAEPMPAAAAFLFDGPPNVMRLAMIALAGLVLVIAVARSRSLLLRAVDETMRRANLTRYLPPRIGAWLAATSVEEVRRGRRQPVAVLFADIRGFTRRAETMDPTALGAFVAEFRRRVTASTDAHGGVVEKFIGDSAMVVFGVPNPGPADARNALRCAEAVLAEIAGWNRERAAAGEDQVEVGIGAHWGEAFCGAIGDDARLEFTVLGDTVNVTARLEQETKAAALPLIVSGDLLDAAGEPAAAGRWLALPTRALRGRHRPIRLFGAGPAG